MGICAQQYPTTINNNLKLINQLVLEFQILYAHNDIMNIILIFIAYLIIKFNIIHKTDN